MFLNLTKVYPAVECDRHGVPINRADVMPAWVKRSVLAARARGTRSQAATVPVSDERAVLAVLSGVALSFEHAGCAIALRDGSSQHERFKSGAFGLADRAPYTQYMTINHSDEIDGRFVYLAEDGQELKFRFELFDGVRERAALAKIQSGAIRSCSVGVTPMEFRYDWNVLEHVRAKLNEVSLCDGRTPAWYGTSVRVLSTSR